LADISRHPKSSKNFSRKFDSVTKVTKLDIPGIMFSRRTVSPVIRDCNVIPPSQRQLYHCPTRKVIVPSQRGSVPVNFATPIASNGCDGNGSFRRCVRKPFTLVLDLDETVVHTFMKEEEPAGLFDIPTSDHYEVDLGIDISSGVKRPHLDEFLERVFKIAYPVIVWTAGHAEYAKEICEHVFKKNWPTHIYTYDDCVVDSNNIIKKPLRKLFEDFPNIIQRDRLVVVDDRKSAYLSKDQEHVIRINKWHGVGEDRSLLQVAEYLEEIKKDPGDLRYQLKQIDWTEYWEDG
jgi:hypothetical protein